MAASVSRVPFEALAASLKESGCAAESVRLESVLNGVWTTSTELISELGATVLAIRRDCHPLSANQRALIKQCLREVRKAFPGFGWLNWRFSGFRML
jgi:hypothetical protein